MRDVSQKMRIHTERRVAGRCVGIGVRSCRTASPGDMMNPYLATLPGSSREECRAGRGRLPAGPSPGHRPGYLLCLPAAPRRHSSGVRGNGPSLGHRVPIQSPSPVGQRFSAPRITRRAGVPGRGLSCAGPAGKRLIRSTVAVATTRRSAVLPPQGLRVCCPKKPEGGWGTSWPTIAGRRSRLLLGWREADAGYGRRVLICARRANWLL